MKKWGADSFLLAGINSIPLSWICLLKSEVTFFHTMCQAALWILINMYQLLVFVSSPQITVHFL